MEENEGRIYVDLSGGDGTGYVNEPPPPLPGNFGNQYGQGYSGAGYGAGQQPLQQQQEDEQDLLTQIFTACKCCALM